MLDNLSVLEMTRYLGQDEPPSNFAYFWEKIVAETAEAKISYELVPKNFSLSFAECFDLYFSSQDDSKIYARLIFPKKDKFPVIFKFHGYQGQSSDWSESFKYVASGIGVVTMDVRGQAGLSNDNSIQNGNTVKGHIVRGVGEGPQNLFYRYVYEDVLRLTTLISQMEQVDETNLMSFGESQGGALALVSAALDPRIKKILAVYPFLSDFRRVLQLKYDTEAYDELHRYFKFFDPFYETEHDFFETLGYIDVKNFASKIKGEVTMLCGLKDDVCPPSTQYAIYNRLITKKEILILPEYGHEALNVKVPDLIFNWATNKNVK